MLSAVLALDSESDLDVYPVLLEPAIVDLHVEAYNLKSSDSPDCLPCLFNGLSNCIVEACRRTCDELDNFRNWACSCSSLSILSGVAI